jgi:hypothetical protein
MPEIRYEDGVTVITVDASDILTQDIAAKGLLAARQSNSNA